MSLDTPPLVSQEVTYYDGSIYSNLIYFVEKYNLAGKLSYDEIPFFADDNAKSMPKPAGIHPSVVSEVMLAFSEHERLLSGSQIGTLLVHSYVNYSYGNNFDQFTSESLNTIITCSDQDINELWQTTNKLYEQYRSVWEEVNPNSDILPNIITGYMNMLNYVIEIRNSHEVIN